MKEPQLVADCVAAMRAAVNIPVTVKCRIGVDDQDPNESLFALVELCAEAGCEIFIVHARKAWLQGLSPKENREVPPLDYEIVRRLKKARPDLTIVLNGGIETITQAATASEGVDGVMLGRAAYGDPFILSDVDEAFFGGRPSEVGRRDIAILMSGYVKEQAKRGVKPHHIVRHMLGLYQGSPGARAWRRALSADGASAGANVIDRALEVVALQHAPAAV